MCTAQYKPCVLKNSLIFNELTQSVHKYTFFRGFTLREIREIEVKGTKLAGYLLRSRPGIEKFFYICLSLSLPLLLIIFAAS